jgi:hypothetical protein
MSKIIFETDDAIFDFDRKLTIDCLKQRQTSLEIEELDNLIDVLSSQPDQSILTSVEHQYFGFVAIQLIKFGEGSAICKICGKRYHSNQLEAFTVEPGRTTFTAPSAKKGGLKRLFRKNPKPIGCSGGDGIKCPEGHMLIFMITWRI